jgi:hypothetical protein
MVFIIASLLGALALTITSVQASTKRGFGWATDNAYAPNIGDKPLITWYHRQYSNSIHIHLIEILTFPNQIGKTAQFLKCLPKSNTFRCSGVQQSGINGINAYPR